MTSTHLMSSQCPVMLNVPTCLPSLYTLPPPQPQPNLLLYSAAHCPVLSEGTLSNPWGSPPASSCSPAPPRPCPDSGSTGRPRAGCVGCTSPAEGNDPDREIDHSLTAKPALHAGPSSKPEGGHFRIHQGCPVKSRLGTVRAEGVPGSPRL